MSVAITSMKLFFTFTRITNIETQKSDCAIPTRYSFMQNEFRSSHADKSIVFDLLFDERRTLSCSCFDYNFTIFVYRFIRIGCVAEVFTCRVFDRSCESHHHYQFHTEVSQDLVNIKDLHTKNDQCNERAHGQDG